MMRKSVAEYIKKISLTRTGGRNHHEILKKYKKTKERSVTRYRALIYIASFRVYVIYIIYIYIKYYLNIIYKYPF